MMIPICSLRYNLIYKSFLIQRYQSLPPYTQIAHLQRVATGQDGLGCEVVFPPALGRPQGLPTRGLSGVL